MSRVVSVTCVHQLDNLDFTHHLEKSEKCIEEQLNELREALSDLLMNRSTDPRLNPGGYGEALAVRQRAMKLLGRGNEGGAL